MAGRGRGRGKPMIPLSGDQLGFGKAEILPPILQPPPSFPLLDYKALPTTITNEMRYLLQLKKDFAEFMHESPNNVLPVVVKKDIERYSDRYQDLLSAKQSYETRYDWTRMPAELKPLKKKRKADKVKGNAKKKQKGVAADSKKVKKDVDVESKLKELEDKETTQNSDADDDDKDDDEADEKDPEDKVEDEEEEVDEEMDEGTDYVNNYFDNGENYEDDEENLDDGAIF